jgi:cyanobactin maturation PatA/PatG family protease
MALAEATSRRFEAGARVVPAGCDCAGGPTRIVFTFGELGYDFATDTRRDVVTSLLPTGESPYNRSHLLALLDQKPNVTPLVTWLLRANETPLYALAPEGPYAAETYRTLLRALADSSVELVSIAGVVAGRVQLSSGAWVDQVVPVPFALYSWSTSALLETATRQNAALHDDDRRALQEVLKDFLTRIYYEKRNRGESPQERALNYAVTNVFQFVSVFAATSKRMLRLDSVQVNKSPVCREGAECYDVQLVFFNPLKRFEEARHVYQFTVDVSDVVPVTVGELRTWALS